MNKTFVVIVISILVSQSGWAVPVTYSDEATFLAATGPLSFESFENTATGSYSEVVTPGFSMTSSSELYPLVIADSFGWAYDGNHTAWFFENLTFNFANPTDAFGLNIRDWGTQGTATLTFSNNIGDELMIAMGVAENMNDLFFGVITDFNFTQVQINNTVTNDGILTDAIHYRQIIEESPPIPEPATLTLFGAGAAALFFRRFKKA